MAEREVHKFLPKPMLAGVSPEPFDSDDYLTEPKLDGCRAYVLYEDGKIRIFSRSLKEHTDSMPDMQEIANNIRGVKSCLLDGEFLAFVDGKMSFAASQGAFSRIGPEEIEERIRTTRILYTVFDVIQINGRDLTSGGLSIPLSKRKKALKRIVRPGPKIRRIKSTRGNAVELFHQYVDMGYEGIIMKRRESLYQQNGRNDNWVKVKPVLEDSYLIIGWTHGTGRREDLFGGLLLGRSDGGDVRYCGIAGTGLSDADLTSLLELMKSREIHDVRMVPDKSFLKKKWAGWCDPIVADIQFQERTNTGKLRFPSYMRLRPDMEKEDVQWTNE